MRNFIRRVFKTETLSLSECTDGYYLYDTIEGHNISMRAKTEQDACIEALLYYQRHLAISKTKYKNLNDKVQGFLDLFPNEED